MNVKTALERMHGKIAIVITSLTLKIPENVYSVNVRMVLSVEPPHSRP